MITSTDTIEALKIIEERYSEISMILIETKIPHRGAYTLLDEIKGVEKYKDIFIRSFTKSGETIFYSKDGVFVSKNLGFKYPKYSKIFNDLAQVDSRYRDWSVFLPDADKDRNE